MTVTICIPAYRAGAFIEATLQSAANQTHRDLRIEIAVDPCEAEENGADATMTAIAPFLKDERIHATVNERRLGWDGNIRALLTRVSTPFYLILPHDDLLHSDYVETLLSLLQRHKDAAVAYGDLWAFGNQLPARKAVLIPNTAGRDRQLLAFLLENAEAMPWRGVTRTEMVDRIGGFPVDGYMGFAVECEYALSLITHGGVARAPRTLYFKRRFPRQTPTASADRIRLRSREELLAAWRAHAARMQEIISQRPAHGETEIRTLIAPALLAAMLRRRLLQGDQQLDPGDIEQTEREIAALNRSGPGGPAGAVAARLNIVLQMRALLQKDSAAAARYAQAAVEADPGCRDALIRLAQQRHDENRILEAFDLLGQADNILPNDVQAAALRRKLYEKLVKLGDGATGG